MEEQDFEDKAIRDLIRHLNENMDNNFAKLHEELSYLRAEMKVELDKLNGKFKQLETSVENVWATIDDMKEESAALKAVKSLQEKEIQSLQQELTNVSKDLVKTKAELKEEREKIIELEDYTRRENLKFNNIPEAREKDQNLTPKQLICDILQKEMNLDPSKIRFQAVHRIGKQKENKNRPVIARFVCREDRDLVFSRKKALQESKRFKDAYVTADYARAIQVERRKLIKAMYAARGKGYEAKVVGRWLHIGEEEYNSENIPEELMDERNDNNSG